MIRGFRTNVPGAAPPLLETERPLPSLEGDQVRVEIEASTFGAAELDAPGGSAWIAGGGGVGRVAEAGSAAGHLVGARVLVSSAVPCGECDFCRRSAVFACTHGAILGQTADGTLASSVVARARWLCAIDGPLAVPGPAAALLAREAATAYAMYARAGVTPGEPVIVIGGDSVAGFLVDIGRARGTRPIAATSAAQARAAAAELSDRPWRIFETSGEKAGRDLARELAGPGSTVALLSTGFDAGASFDAAPLLAREVAVFGITGAHPDLLPEVAALAVRRELDLDRAAVIASISDPQSAPAQARAARAAGKTLVLTFG